MAQVQYNGGVPSVTPEAAPANDYQHVEASPAAFGSQVSGATEKLGQATSNVAQFFGEVQTDDAVNGAMTRVNQTLDHYRSLNGADALNAQGDTQEAVNEAFAEGRKGLGSARQQYQYDQTVRSFQQRYVNGLITSHADEQAKVYAAKTAQTSTELALQGIANVADDPDKVEGFRENLRHAMVSASKVLNGNDPDAANAALTKADQLAYKTQAETVAVKDPVRAQQIIESHKDVMGQYYAPLMEQFQGKADQETATSAVNQTIREVGLDVQPPPPPGSIIPPAQIHAALIGQESGGNPNAPNSTDGAVGIGQIMPGTFAHYAKPGEDIHSPADNLAVSRRITDDLYQKTGGDPQRMAVGYFSGAGNIAPPGSPTPWINDAKDGNGKSVSSYVSDVTQRLNTPAVTIKGDGYAKILAMNLNPRARDEALRQYSQHINAAEIASMTNAKAVKDASDQAEGQVVKQILTNPTGLSDTDLANNPNLSADAKIKMSALLKEHLKGTQDGAASTYGDKFYDTLKAVTAPPGDPSRISDPSQIYQMALPGGGLTLSGADKLAEVAQKSKTADGGADSKVLAGAMAYAKHQLSFEADYGSYKVRDPAGEDRFNIGFTPAFMSYWQKGIAAGKSPSELADQKSIDGLLAPFKRSPAELKRDQIQSGLETAPNGMTAPQGAVEYLRTNPALRTQFDAKYGAGAADAVLGPQK